MSETNGQLQYQLYLESDHWKELRALVIERDKCCVRCGSGERLQAHHKFYRRRWEDSVAGDLITLCRGCHEKEHGIVEVVFETIQELMAARGRREITREQFKRWKVKLGVDAGGIVSRVGNRRWDWRGQRVSKRGKAYGPRARHLTKKQRKRHKQLTKYHDWAMRAFRVS